MPEILALGTFVSLAVPQISPNNVLTSQQPYCSSSCMNATLWQADF